MLKSVIKGMQKSNGNALRQATEMWRGSETLQVALDWSLATRLLKATTDAIDHPKAHKLQGPCLPLRHQPLSPWHMGEGGSSRTAGEGRQPGCRSGWPPPDNNKLTPPKAHASPCICVANLQVKITAFFRSPSKCYNCLVPTIVYRLRRTAGSWSFHL